MKKNLDASAVPKFRFGISIAVLGLGLSLGSLLATAQGFRGVPGHEVSSLGIFQIRHYHPPDRLETLASLRADVHRAVAMNNPMAAIAALRQITAIEPHDYYAWEFLSYGYAVVGDAGSAANVDLDTVAYFEFIPDARVQVSRAMARLQTFDPNGWQERVERIRGSRLPYVPTEAIDHFIDVIRPDISGESRAIAYSRVETVLERREHRVVFINKWTQAINDRGRVREEVETDAVWRMTAEVVRALR